MKKGKKFVILSLTVVAALSIPVGAAVAVRISSERNCGRTKPPIMRVDNEQEPAESDTNGMVFGDGERDFCLGYLDNFEDEEVTGDESAAEAERITRKNALIQEYREYVEALYGQSMTTEEYEIHYQHLMDIFCDELLPLEPEPTPEKQIEIKIAQLLSGLKDDLCFSEINGEAYIKSRRVDVSALKKSIEDLTLLQEKIDAKQLTLEQLQQEFAICLEVVKKASPEIYEAWILNE